MSLTIDGPEAQNSLLKSNSSLNVPAHLSRSTFRLEFPPSYVIVGAYRLCTDKLLYGPAWDKCRHGVRRGAIVGFVWTVMTFGIQRQFVRFFLANSPRITGLSNDMVFGYHIPFNVHTYAALLFVGSQFTFILKFFLSRNLHITSSRVWDQTVASRSVNHGADFFQPYVEEWDKPPKMLKRTSFDKVISFLMKGPIGRLVVKQVLLMPFALYPLVGILTSAWLKGLNTAEYLHTKYFDAKKMTPHEREIFVEERKWDYRFFGFTAALLESLPFIGLFFTVSNRVGAAMWAYDLEKRQHFVASEKQKRR